MMVMIRDLQARCFHNNLPNIEGGPVGKQQNWFYGTNSGSLPSMTLLDLFQRLTKNGDDDINGITIRWSTSYK